MRRLAIFTALIIPIVMSIAFAGWADHAPEWQMSTKKPETRLAGIQVGKTSIDAARKILGEPARFQDLPESPGEAEYVWEHSDVQVVLGTLYDPEHRSAKGEIVYSVKVSGARAPKGYTTGAGVKLGDDLRALIRAYGPVYSTSWRPSTLGTTTFTFIFEDETELSASLSYDEGKIVALDLMASIE